LSHPDLSAGNHDVILANILMGPLISLAPDMASANRRGGRAILSGILNSQADEVSGHYFAAGYDLEDRREIGDWTTLVLRRSD